MAATAQQISRTVVVGNGAAVAFDARDAFSTGRIVHSNLRIAVLHATAIVGVAFNGGTATIGGDDVRHVTPTLPLTIPWPKDGLLSLRSDTAATNVEISGA
jgi:hypothetical protein